MPTNPINPARGAASPTPVPTLPFDPAAIRLIATDLDGTLLRDDRSISARTCQALARARAAGMVIVLASARPPRILREFARAAGVDGLAICCNGAILYDLDADAILHHAPLESSAAREVVRALRSAAPGVCFGLEQGMDYACEPGYLALRGTKGDEPQRCGDAIALCAEPVTKLLMRHPTLAIEELLHLAGEVIRPPVTLTHSGGRFVEIAAPGVHKAWALDRLCADLAITASEVLAFGDMPNDLPLLTWAGCGVAVANAHPDVLARADLVTATNEADGVALVVERILAFRLPA